MIGVAAGNFYGNEYQFGAESWDGIESCAAGGAYRGWARDLGESGTGARGASGVSVFDLVGGVQCWARGIGGSRSAFDSYDRVQPGLVLFRDHSGHCDVARGLGDVAP